MFRGFAVLGLLLGLAAPVAAQRTGGTGDCDRACLTGIADAYIAALVAHTPSKAPLASNVKFTGAGAGARGGRRPLEDHDTETTSIPACQSNHWHRAACSARSGP